MEKLRPTPTSNHFKASTFVQKELNTCSHVFVRVGAIRPPLSQPYNGPYRVIRRKKKVFVVEINGKPCPISIDRLKAAFTQADEPIRAPAQPNTTGSSELLTNPKPTTSKTEPKPKTRTSEPKSSQTRKPELILKTSKTRSSKNPAHHRSYLAIRPDQDVT